MRLLDFFRPKAEEARHRSDLLPRSRFAQRGARPRVVSGRADQPGAQRPAGDARRRPAGGPHEADGHRRGARPDRHRLRHGRQDARRGFSRPSIRPSPAAPAWACPPRARSSKPTAARSRCKASWAAARSSRSSCPLPLGSRPCAISRPNEPGKMPAWHAGAVRLGVSAAGWQSVEKCRRGIFQPRQGRSKAPPGSQNNDLRRNFGIASMRSRRAVEFFNRLPASARRCPGPGTLGRSFPALRPRRRPSRGSAASL